MAKTEQNNKPIGGGRPTAKDAIAEVFSHLRISRVVYVDDLFELRDREVDQVVGLLEEALHRGEERWANMFPGVSLDEEREIWIPEFKARWEGIEPAKKDEIVRALYEEVYEKGETALENLREDFNAISVLRDLVPGGVDLRELGPSEWRDGAEDLMRAAPDTRVLCLFDRDLRHARAFLGERDVDGVDLLIEAVAARNRGDDEPSDVVIFGLFSHTFTLNNELPEWRRIASDHGIGQDDFLPLSKQRQQDESLLAKGLQMMVLNMFSARLKRTIAQALGEAYEKACESMLTLEVYNFDEMVLRSSEVEGAWEADTLFRLFQIYHRDAAREAILQDDIAKRFNADVADARHISRQRVGDESHPPEQLWGLRHQELYLAGALLNPFHAPLRSGDLFRVKWPGKSPRLYILLAQPCDLAVRFDGGRSSGTATLLRVEKMKREKLRDLRSRFFEQRGVDLLETNGVIRYFEGGKADVGLVKFKEALVLSTDVLDLAVLSNEGSCRINVDEPPSCPVQFPEGWKARYAFLVNYFAEKHALLTKLNKTLGAVRNPHSQNLLWSSTIRSVLALDDRFSSEVYRERGLDFGVVRIRHFREPGISRLLTAYTRFLSRPADAHDFADESHRRVAAA